MATSATSSNHHLTSACRADSSARVLTDAELLDMISAADACGYRVQDAHQRDADHPLMTDIRTVWFALRHGIPVVEHNIEALTAYVTWMKNGSHVGHHAQVENGNVSAEAPSLEQHFGDTLIHGAVA